MNAHNGGIWQNLESKVRTIANNSDTTYVVTGCVVEGSTNTTVDSDGKKMTIPKAYFKALLRYGKSSTIGEWTSAAYYLEHKSYPKVDGGYDLKAVSMSVDRLEEMTGIDFFVNLPAKVGEDQAARVEAQDPKNSSMWW
jgi:endonuclease G